MPQARILMVEPSPEQLGYVAVPFSDARPMQGDIMALANSPYAAELGHGGAHSRMVAYPWYGAKDIRFEDHVKFSDTETDFYAMPKMTIHYTGTARDLEVIDELKVNARRSAERLGTLLEAPELAAGGSSLHYQGTVRMGPSDDGTSVCDSHLRVWGVDQLWVGGNGVIATARAANPTLTTVALAWRAAVRLAESLIGHSVDQRPDRP